MSLQLLNVTNLPIYLPFDKAQIPFGDPLEGVTCTSASPGVVTAPGYVPVNGDLVSLTFLTGGSIPTGLTAATPYYVVAASGQTFQVSATKGGSAINTSSTGSLLVLHLLSGQTDGVALPFKPGNSVVVVNPSGGQLILQGANDKNAGFGVPGGPDTYSTIVTVAANALAQAVLSYDWIRVSTSGTLALLQV